MLLKTTVATLITAAIADIPGPGMNKAHGSFDEGVHHGIATIYQQKDAVGSCGIQNADSSMIVALSNKIMKNRYKSPHCGRQIRVYNKRNSNSIDVTVQDTCMSCKRDHLDLSLGAWQALTDHAEWGRVPIVWEVI